MQQRFAILLIFWSLAAAATRAQAIPPTATVLEKRNVTPARRLVLWMPRPEKKPRTEPREAYTCPEETRGHYSGEARVSLVDARTRRVVNTIAIRAGGAAGGRIDLPYLIHRGYYGVPRVDRNEEGKPVVMALKDYNGDGRAHEFALFDAVACMGLPTPLIGYSVKQDKVVQYRIALKNGAATTYEYWLDYLFARRPTSPGRWRYEVDYRGRAGTLDRYEVRYDAGREEFFAVVTSTESEDPE